MDWSSNFEKVFFSTWHKAGLPNHEDYINEYNELRNKGGIQSDWIKTLPEISPGIDGFQLHSVYGFGVVMGKIFSELLGLNAIKNDTVADWCGRFNLGISLFDYISDELSGIDRVASLNVFQSFTGVDNYENKPLSRAEQLLSKLTQSILNDLDKLVIKKRKSEVSDIFIEALQQMFKAEHFVSKSRLSSNADLDQVENALYLKSAGPFRIMAEYCATIAEDLDISLTNKIPDIGGSLGNCYWLIDDAKDVWHDLESGHWNLFLRFACTKNPHIFKDNPDKDLHNQLLTTWLQSNYVESVSLKFINQLVKDIRRINLPGNAVNHELGMIGASLWQWYKY